MSSPIVSLDAFRRAQAGHIETTLYEGARALPKSQFKKLNTSDAFNALTQRPDFASTGTTAIQLINAYVDHLKANAKGMWLLHINSQTPQPKISLTVECFADRAQLVAFEEADHHMPYRKINDTAWACLRGHLDIGKFQAFRASIEAADRGHTIPHHPELPFNYLKFLRTSCPLPPAPANTLL